MRNPRLASVFCELYDNDIDAFQSATVVKPAMMNFDFQGWHQDAPDYIPLSNYKLSSALTYLGEMGPDTGGTSLVPGSHRDGLFERGYVEMPGWPVRKRFIVGFEKYESRIVTPQFRPGDVLIFHPCVMHRANSNYTQVSKIGLINAYRSVDCIDIEQRSRHGTMVTLPRIRERRFGCVARSFRNLLRAIAGCLLTVGFAASAESAEGEVGKLMAEAVRAIGEGDFGSAWKSHRRALQLAVDSPKAGRAMDEFCGSHDCPRIRSTAWLVGEPSSELGSLTAECRGSESGTCRKWINGLDRLRAQLGSEQRAPVDSPHDVELWFLHLESGDLRPWMVVSVAGKPVWAIVDTGAPQPFMGRAWANLHGLEYTIVGDPFTQIFWDEAAVRRRMVVLRDVEIGSATEERMLAVAHDGAEWGFFALGMDILLRHGSVCFAWAESTLYLGRLGPCEGGAAPYGARLEPSSQRPVILVPATDGTTVPVLIDTGARNNHCKRSLATRLQGGALAFGDHASLRATCGSARWGHIGEDHPRSMTIGMETLSRFEAFGWELDPFRMYFVPRSPGSTVKGFDAGRIPQRRQEVVEERLERAIEATVEGDFPAAWSSLRLGYWTALSSQEAADSKTAFCARRACPDIWRIAWLAGRPSSHLSFLGGVCEDITVDACSRWLALQHVGRNYLGPVRRPPSNPAQDVPMSFNEGTGDGRLRAMVEVDGITTSALLNTGARHSGFRRRWASMEGVAYEVVDDPYIETRPAGIERRAREVILRNLRVGGVVERSVRAIARDDRDAEFELGIDVLLRYDSVCFSLADRRLYLGGLGPCSGGHSPMRSGLDVASMRPIVFVPLGDGTVSVLVDTGTRGDLCTASLAKRLDGGALRLVGDGVVEASCGQETDRRLKDDEPHDMVVGLETLYGLEAFGWELDPFRMYFVPADGAS